jgi:hypothetical protein
MDGQLREEISTASTDVVTWRPDSSGVFFVSGGTLYSAPLGSQPQPVYENVLAGVDGGIGWVIR